MDGDQGKKRKLDVVEEEEEEEEVEEEKEEESEESKMEKFYELIRISKDIRARMMMINAERFKEEEKIKKRAINESKGPSVGAWNPTFQLEDFMEDVGLDVILSCPSRIKNNETGTPSNFKKADDGGCRGEGGDDKGGSDDGLDLNLSL